MFDPLMSRSPVTLPAQNQKIYSEIRLTSLNAKEVDGSVSMDAVFDLYNGTKVLPGYSFKVKIDDLSNEFAKLKFAWSNISDVLGLYYEYQHLTMEINRSLKKGEDVISLTNLLNVITRKIQDPTVPIRT